MARLHRHIGPRNSIATGAATLAAASAFIVWVGPLGQISYGSDQAVRYASPVLIGVIPVALTLMSHRGDGKRSPWRWAGVAIVAGFCVAFAPSAWARAQRAVHKHTNIAFVDRWPEEAWQQYAFYNQAVLSGPFTERLGKMQNLVPPGEPMVAWVSTPFLLDL